MFVGKSQLGTLKAAPNWNNADALPGYLRQRFSNTDENPVDCVQTVLLGLVFSILNIKATGEYAEIELKGLVDQYAWAFCGVDESTRLAAFED